MGAAKRVLKKRAFLGEVIAEMGFATPEQVKKAVAKSQKGGVRVGQVLVAEGLISDTDLVKALSKQYDMEYVDLRGVDPTDEALDLIPHAMASQVPVLPIKLENKILTVAIYDPSNTLTLGQLEKRLPVSIQTVVSAERPLRLSIENAYLRRRAHLDQEKKKQQKIKQIKATDEGEIESLINRILEMAIGHQASDIHIEPQEHEIQVRERIDGILEGSMELPLELHPAIVSRMKILGRLDIAEKRNPQDGRFKHDVNNNEVDFRISTLPTIRGEKVVLRILDKSNMKIGLDNLGLNKTLAGQVRSLLANPHGIILVSGPTGSGKTTTVYSMLNYINSIEKNIITIEDPVEYQFNMINQVQVNSKAGLTFPTILRNILRQDPDIIMVGEVRDKETAEIAIRAALTGHLVISTIHTNDAITAVSRLIDMGIDPFLISSSLLGVIAQRLVRKVCKHCGEVSTAPFDSDSQLAIDILEKHGKIMRAKGCLECFNSGYLGREGIYEVLTLDKEIRRAVNEGATVDKITDLVYGRGFQNLRDNGIEKVQNGVTTVDEVLRGTIDTEE